MTKKKKLFTIIVFLRNESYIHSEGSICEWDVCQMEVFLRGEKFRMFKRMPDSKSQ